MHVARVRPEFLQWMNDRLWSFQSTGMQILFTEIAISGMHQPSSTFCVPAADFQLADLCSKASLRDLRLALFSTHIDSGEPELSSSPNHTWYRGEIANRLPKANQPIDALTQPTLDRYDAHACLGMPERVDVTWQRFDHSSYT